MNSATRGVHLVAATVGFLSYALLWLAVLWGQVLRNSWAMTRLRHSTVAALHQNIALLGLTLGIVHAFAQLAAPDGPVRLVDEFVPFVNPHDPVGIGVGVIALEVLTAITLSVLVQKKLGFSRWRAVHSLIYPAFTLLTAHILISGSDTGSPVVWGLVLAAWLVTVALWSATTPWMQSARRRLTDHASRSHRSRELTVHVDARACTRFGFCEHEAPEVFHLRGDGRLAYRRSVTRDHAEDVIRAAAVCPARAISLDRQVGTVMTAPVTEPVTTPPADAALDGVGPPTPGSLERPTHATVTRLQRRRARS